MKSLKLLLTAFLLYHSVTLKALTVVAPSIITCPGQFTVPIIFNNADYVGAVSLKLDFDQNIIHYIGYQNVNYQLLTGFLQINSTSSVYLAWFSTIPLNMANDTLLELIFTGNTGNSYLNWDLNSCQIANLIGFPINSGYVNGGVTFGNCPILDGKVLYNNAASTPMANMTVLLLQNNNEILQTVTDSSGYFYFMNISEGTYMLDGIGNESWAGVNATDALLILHHFVGIAMLTGLNNTAADVDTSGIINAADALMVIKRFSGMINSFPGGNWIFEKSVIEIESNTYMTKNLRVLCTGDVNGSL